MLYALGVGLYYMKKYFLMITVIALIIPSFTLASWWNPISWFNNWTFTKEPNKGIELLENKIKELENKIENMKIASSTTQTNIATPTILIDKVVPSSTPAVKSSVKPVIKNSVSNYSNKVIVNTDVVTQPRYSNEDFLNLFSNFLSFMNKLTFDQNTISDSETNSIRLAYKVYLLELLEIIKKDYSELGKIANINPKPSDVMKLFTDKYEQYLKSYDSRKLQLSKSLVIEYFLDNKEYLHTPDIHVKAAELLDLFDRTFNTKYATVFKATKTYQETVEFANSFLLDVK